MGLRINTNVSSLTAQKNLAKTQGALERSLDRLSSGLRITRAGDDAAGLAISESLRAQVRGNHRPTAISVGQGRFFFGERMGAKALLPACLDCFEHGCILISL